MAPAEISPRAAATIVAPVVRTSSTNKMRSPLSGSPLHANAPRTFSRRSCSPRPTCEGVSTRRINPADRGNSIRLAKCRVNNSDWSKPRCRLRRGCNGTNAIASQLGASTNSGRKIPRNISSARELARANSPWYLNRWIVSRIGPANAKAARNEPISEGHPAHDPHVMHGSVDGSPHR